MAEEEITLYVDEKGRLIHVGNDMFLADKNGCVVLHASSRELPKIDFMKIIKATEIKLQIKC